MENKPLDVWTSYKELNQLVEACISKPIDNVSGSLHKALVKYKHNFLHVMKNPPKNARSRKIIENKASANGATLPQEIVDEAITLSNMFNLDEQFALDLLCTAQQRLADYPGITRGPVSILLYYDAHYSFATTLKMLVHGHQGLRWESNCSTEVQKCVTKFVDELVIDGLFEAIFAALSSMDLAKEINLLQQNRGLGGAYHHHMVTSLFNGIRETLADVVLLYSAQCGLSLQPLMSLMSHLKNMKPQFEANGALDNVSVSLFTAFLYSIDVSIVQEKDYLENIHTFIPLLREDNLINRIDEALGSAQPQWSCLGLKTVAQFAWGLTLTNVRSVASSVRAIDSIPDDDDNLITQCINDNVFKFLNQAVLTSDAIFKQELCLRRFHTLITDFIVLMPVHVRELRARADEESLKIQAHLNEGLHPPNDLEKHFEQFLQTVGRLYSKDPLNLKLHQEFWCLQDPAASYKARIPPKQICLLKCIKQCGEKLPSQLFIPYVNMLSALTASPEVARETFNMLKNYAQHFCWDHFFNSLQWHLMHLRQDMTPVSDTIYHRHHARSIAPLEVQGLRAVLYLIRTVACHDELSRQKFCEHTQWNAIQVVIGLLNCSVHIELKAELVLTLAAFAKSTSIATNLWHQLEAAQLIPTVPTTSNFQPRGVLSELEEVESRNEEYPLTRAVLELLDELTNTPVPFTLGSGSRVPGLDPYIQYVLNSVLLKFNNRAYKHVSEKWEIAQACVHLLVKFAFAYEPQHEDFTGNCINTQDGVVKVNPHPGYHVMINMCSQSQLLRTIFYILDEGCLLLDSHTSFPGKSVLESVTLECLKLVSSVLDLQRTFLSFVSNYDTSIFLNGLHKLMFGMNPRSNQPDYAVNIAKYITYNSWLPSHAHYSAKILRVVTSYVSAQNELLSSIIVSNTFKQQLLHGFVKCLETDELGDDEQQRASSLVCKTKVLILKLILQCFNYHAPNFSQFLCGFDLKNVSKTTLQHAGVLGFPRSCLHSIISILGVSLKARTEATLTPPPALVTRLCYEVLYSLAAHTITSASTLRFLRSSNDVLLLHLSGLPFETNNRTEDLYQTAWLLKTVAIELRVTAHHSQLSQLSKLVNLLINGGLNVDQFNANQSSIRSNISGTSNPQSGHRLILKLLQSIDFSHKPMEKPVWENFEESKVFEILEEAEFLAEPNLKKINVKRVRRILVQEITSITEWASLTQKQRVMNDVDAIIDFAVKYNDSKQSMHALWSYFDAWKQMVNVLFAVTPQNMIPFQNRFDVLVQIVHCLLQSVLVEYVRPDLATICSESLLLMLCNLRSCLVAERHSKEKIQLSQLISPHDLILKQIVTSIISWILDSSATTQKLRANLYASLLTFLHIAREDALSLRHLSSQGDNVDPLLDHSNDFDFSNSIGYENVSISLPFNISVSEFPEKLVDILCVDVTGGHDICKMLALSTLSSMIEMNNRWVSYLSTRGFLIYMLESLVTSDKALLDALLNQNENLRPLFVFEAKMTFLTRVSQSREGAELLLEHNVMYSLSHMSVFSHHPDVPFFNAEYDDVSPGDTKFQQLIMPTLQFLQSILNSLGSRNRSATSQIMGFVLDHFESLAIVLRYGNPLLPVGILKELAALTSIIATTYSQSEYDVTKEFVRLQNLMISLVHRFLICEKLTKQIQSTHSKSDLVEVMNAVLDIQCNILLFLKNLTAASGMDKRVTNVILEPTMTPSEQQQQSNVDHLYTSSGAANLGVIIRQLVDAVAHYHRETPNLTLLANKITSVQDMNATTLNELVPNMNTSISMEETRRVAKTEIIKLYSMKKLELSKTRFIVDTCLYLVWAHLDYFMLRGIPDSLISSKTSPNSVNMSLSRLGYSTSLTETVWDSSVDQLQKVREHLVTIFNETFSHSLVKTTEASEKDQSYVEALLRRIKKLIQFAPTDVIYEEK